MEAQTIKNDRSFISVLAVVSLVFGLFLLQDFMHSELKDYNFYLSESALFNGFWLLFLPGLFCSEWLCRRWGTAGNVNYLHTVLIFFVVVVLHIILFTCWVHGGSWLFLDHVYGVKWTFRYALADKLYLAIIGYVFAAVLRRKHLMVGSRTTTDSTPTFTQRLTVKTNLQIVYLDVESIIYLRAESPYVAIHTEERKYLEDTTLKALSVQLPPDQFVRIHRSCIINLSWINAMVSRGNGDYDLVLKDESIHRLSRNYATEYKQRMAAHQLTP